MTLSASFQGSVTDSQSC